MVNFPCAILPPQLDRTQIYLAERQSICWRSAEDEMIFCLCD